MCLFGFRNVLTSVRVNVEVTQAEIQKENKLPRVVANFVPFFISKRFLERLLVLRYWLEDKVFGLNVTVDHPTIVDLLKA